MPCFLFVQEKGVNVPLNGHSERQSLLQALAAQKGGFFMSVPLSSDPLGSVTPQLEGAPRSQSHATRVVAAPLHPNQTPSAEEKGAEHESSPSTSA